MADETQRATSPAGPGSGSGSSPAEVVRDILHGLTEGRYAPGQRLVEPDLMRRYGVGRSTVREALSRLAAEGVVTLAPHRGAQIRLLTRREADDVLRVTELLLGLVARQAAETVATSTDGTAAEALSMAADIYFATAAGASGLPQARARYYRALTRLAGNRELERLLPSVQVHLIRAQLRLERPGGGVDHRALVRAVLAGDGARAEAAARRHVRRLSAALPGLPDSAFAPDPAGG
jgi:DNA-binding GntR family transcriptional regulator